MEIELKNGKVYKYINANGDHLLFEYDGKECFIVYFFNEQEKTQTTFYGNFEQTLDTANELIFNYKLQRNI